MEIVIQHVDFFDSVSVGNSVLDENLWQITIFVEAFEMFENQMCFFVPGGFVGKQDQVCIDVHPRRVLF